MEAAKIFFVLSLQIFGVFGSYSSNLPREPFAPPCADLVLTNEHWVVQKLDHYNLANSRSWKQRYFANFDFFSQNGPVFIVVGGSWHISSGFVCSGLAVEMAKKHGGIVFYLEHRFYGKSYPTKNASPENLEFLTVDQALMDLENFISIQKESIIGMKESNIILFGTHYGGTLALLFQLRFPDLVTGVWASSAPLVASESHPEILNYASKAIVRFGGRECYIKVESAFHIMQTEIEKADTWDYEDIFRFCPGLDFTDVNDRGSFFFEIMKLFLSLAQTNDNSFSSLLCNHMMDPKYVDPVEALAAFITPEDGPCIDYSFRHLIASTKQSAWDKSPDLWPYQLCNEFGWFPSYTINKTAFGNVFPINFFKNICFALYRTPATKLVSGMKAINERFRFKTLRNSTNRIVTYGQFDPWKLIDGGYFLPSEIMIIKNTSYSGDLWTNSQKISEEVRSARSIIMAKIKLWLIRKEVGISSHSRSSIFILILNFMFCMFSHLLSR